MHSVRYLRDKICPGGGCELATIARTRATWGRFRELLPLLTSTTISLARREKLYGSSLRGIYFMLANVFSLRREEVQRLLRNERAMLRWMLKIKAEDNVSLSTIYEQLNLAPLESKLRLIHRRWYGHVERSDEWIHKSTQLEIGGFKGRGRPRTTWIATMTLMEIMHMICVEETTKDNYEKPYP